MKRNNGVKIQVLPYKEKPGIFIIEIDTEVKKSLIELVNSIQTPPRIKIRRNE